MGSGIPPIGRCGGGPSCSGPGPPPPSSCGPGSEPPRRKSSSGTNATSRSIQTVPIHSNAPAACSPTATTRPTIHGRAMQMTNPAKRSQNRERRRSVESRMALMTMPRGMNASDRTATTMGEDYCSLEGSSHACAAARSGRPPAPGDAACPGSRSSSRPGSGRRRRRGSSPRPACPRGRGTRRPVGR